MLGSFLVFELPSGQLNSKFCQFAFENAIILVLKVVIERILGFIEIELLLFDKVVGEFRLSAEVLKLIWMQERANTDI